MDGGGWWVEKRHCRVQLPSARDCLRSLPPPQDLKRSDHPWFLWPPGMAESVPYYTGTTVSGTVRKTHRPHTDTSLLQVAAYNQTKMWFVPSLYLLFIPQPSVDYLPRLLLWDCQCRAAVSACVQASDAVLCSLESEKSCFSVMGTPHLVAWVWRACKMRYKHGYFYIGYPSSLPLKLKWASVPSGQHFENRLHKQYPVHRKGRLLCATGFFAEYTHVCILVIFRT